MPFPPSSGQYEQVASACVTPLVSRRFIFSAPTTSATFARPDSTAYSASYRATDPDAHASSQRVIDLKRSPAGSISVANEARCSWLANRPGAQEPTQTPSTSLLSTPASSSAPLPASTTRS
jgi:hypothetical protein